MTKVEELRKQLTTSNSEYLCWSKSWGTKAIDELIAAAEAQGVKKGAEQEREEWRESCTAIASGEEVLTLYTHRGSWDGGDSIFADEDILVLPVSALSFWITPPASVLSPAPIQKVRGEPSQALIDELNELASVLAPKEKP